MGGTLLFIYYYPISRYEFVKNIGMSLSHTRDKNNTWLRVRKQEYISGIDIIKNKHGFQGKVQRENQFN